MSMGDTLGELNVKINADSSGLKNGLFSAESSTKGSMGKMGTAIKVGAIGAVAAIGGIAVKSVQMAASFEGSMREVNTMIGLSDEEFQKLQDSVMDLSKEVGVAGGELASALYQTVSAGIPAGEAIDFLRVASQAAVGGVTNAETAVDGLTTVINAFKMDTADAGKVADIMFTTVKGGKTTFEELSASMFQVAPLAASAGVGFEEVSAALATMTKQGVPTRVATTQLKMALQGFIKPTAEATKVSEELGIDMSYAALESQGLAAVLADVQEKTGGNVETMSQLFGSIEGLNAVLALTGENAETFASDLEAMYDSTGSATEAYEEVNKGLGRQFEMLKMEFQGMMVELGQKLMPVIRALIPIISKIIDALPIEQIAKLIDTAIVPLIAFIGELVARIQPIFGKLLDPLLNVLGVLMDALFPILDAILEPLLRLLDVLIGVLVPIIDLFAVVADVLLSVLVPAFKILMVPINILVTVLEYVGKAIGWLLGIFQSFWGKVKEGWDKLKDILAAPFNALMGVVETVLNWIIRQLNKISFDIPSWVPFVGGKKFGINISEVSLPRWGGGEEEEKKKVDNTAKIAEIGEKREELETEQDRLRSLEKPSGMTDADWEVHIKSAMSDIANKLSYLDQQELALRSMRKGGIVTKPTRALIGEAGPEAVVPLGAGAGLAPITVVIQCEAFMGNEAQARAFSRKVGKYIREDNRTRTIGRLA